MENKQFYWKDAKITLMGTEINCKPIQYIPGKTSMEFEGSINITRNEVVTLFYQNKEVKKPKKLSNYQRKKAWKKFCKIFNIEL